MTIRVLSLGELLMRLKTPGLQRFSQADSYEASFGGAEANVAVSLAQFGYKPSLLTAVPSNPIGAKAKQELARWGVATDQILERQGRLGLYFMETGANHRSGDVVYDRDHSVFSELSPENVDWDAIIPHFDWLHLSGISPAVSQSAADFCLAAVKAAKAAEIKVSFDLNFRSKLWRYGRPPKDVLDPIMNYVDVLIAGRGDCQQCLDVHGSGDPETNAYYEQLSQTMMETYPNVKTMAITIRQTLSANHHKWRACLRNGEGIQFSTEYEIKNIVDRVGTGDAFSAGLIFGLCESLSATDTLAFASAANCLKHSIEGDFNLSSVEEVKNLINNGQLAGHVNR